MGNSVSSIANNQTVKPGLCPHGTIPGACPICSGMGGGGRVGEHPQKAGEMSYHECAMIGAIMRAREAQKKLHEQTLAVRAENLRTFEQNLIRLAEKMSEFMSVMQNNFPILSKPLGIIINNIVVPIIKSVSAVIGVLSNIGEKFAQIKEKFIDIMDKLNAIFGEAKAFVEKKVSELISTIKTKFKNLFKIFKRNKTDDDETKIDEDKKIFRLKTFIQKLTGKYKDDSENKSRS